MFVWQSPLNLVKTNPKTNTFMDTTENYPTSAESGFTHIEIPTFEDLSQDSIRAQFGELSKKLEDMDSKWDRAKVRASNEALQKGIKGNTISDDYATLSKSCDLLAERLKLSLNNLSARAHKALELVSCKDMLSFEVDQIKASPGEQQNKIALLKERLAINKINEQEVNLEFPKAEKLYNHFYYDVYRQSPPEKTLIYDQKVNIAILSGFTLLEGYLTFKNISGLRDLGLDRVYVIPISIVITVSICFAVHEIGALFIKKAKL